MNNLNQKHQPAETSLRSALARNAFLVSACLAFLTASSDAPVMAQYNGSFVDFRPVPGLESTRKFDVPSTISDDGLTMWFNSGNDHVDIFKATRESVEDSFDEPIRIDSLSRSGPSDEGMTITSDGLTAYFSSDAPAGSRNRWGIWTSTRESVDSEWGEPEYFDTGSDAQLVAHPRLSSDDLTLYVDSFRTRWQKDLFKMERASVSEPFGDMVPITELNTSRNAEFLPSVSSDDLAIFYSSATTAPSNMHMKIATRATKDEPFGKPVHIDDFGLGSNFSETFNLSWVPVISSDWPADGSKLYFTRAESNSSEYEIYEATWNVEQVGDFSADGSLDVDDLDRLTSEIRSGSTHRQYDVDQSGTVDLADRDYWVTDLKSTWIGDANLDGQVTATDLNALALNWRATGVTSWSQGDFTGDGIVDASDLNAMALNWQSGIPVATASPAAVPEPSSLAMLLFGLCALARRTVGAT